MTLKRDIDRGFRNPFFVTTFIDNESEEPIAIFPEISSIPIPDEGDVIEIESYKQSMDGEGEGESLGEFTVNNIQYEYSLAEPPDEVLNEGDEDGEKNPDILYVTTEVFVTPVDI